MQVQGRVFPSRLHWRTTRIVKPYGPHASPRTRNPAPPPYFPAAHLPGTAGLPDQPSSYIKPPSFLLRQALLDDQIVKTQSMRASPYIKPLEVQAQAWEVLMVTLQEIVDNWLTCQV